MYYEYDERCQIKNYFEKLRNSPLGFSHGDNLFDRNYPIDSNEIFEHYDSFGRTPDLNSNPRNTGANKTLLSNQETVKKSEKEENKESPSTFIFRRDNQYGTDDSLDNNEIWGNSYHSLRKENELSVGANILFPSYQENDKKRQKKKKRICFNNHFIKKKNE